MAAGDLTLQLYALLGEIERLVALSEPAAGPARRFLAAVRPRIADPAGSVIAAPRSCDLPVGHWLGELASRPTDGSPAARVLGGFHALAPRLPWRQNPNYTEATVGRHFLDGYGYLELRGPEGPVVDTAALVGVLVLGPERHYRVHHHPAEEVYIPLAGRAEWWRPDLGWRQEAPGAIIHHAPDVPHATRTLGEPLAALYLWSGEVATYARLGSARGADG